jgi:hypothetical protein
VTCTGLKDSIGILPLSSPLVLELRSDIGLSGGTEVKSLQASLLDPGSPGDLGSVQWTDQSGYFRWVEGNYPLARGTLWQ